MTIETVLLYPAPPARAVPVSRVRSTLLSSSIAEVRKLGKYERYAKLLPPQHVESIEALVPGVWLPLDLAMVHYRACDGLSLTQEEMLAMGASVGARVQSSVISTLTRLATGAGATPWIAYAQSDRLWQRMFEGGGVTIRKLGPKEAEIEMSQLPLARFEYFRTSFCGVQRVGAQLFAQKVYVRELVARGTESSFVVLVSWV